jgi:hypothetical protein
MSIYATERPADFLSGADPLGRPLRVSYSVRSLTTDGFRFAIRPGGG